MNDRMVDLVGSAMAGSQMAWESSKMYWKTKAYIAIATMREPDLRMRLAGELASVGVSWGQNIEAILPLWQAMVDAALDE
jgi:hypothetical protein